MARMPGAEWQGEHGSRYMTAYDIVCVHTIVGYAPAHAAHFSVKANGRILQSRDTVFQSGANLEGNPRIIAIENEDHGDAFGGTRELPEWVPLTPEQVESNARILEWVHQTHGTPLQLCPNSKPGSKGLAYHRQGIDGNFGGYRFPGRVPGGEVWTLSRGKVCPTDTRIAQLPDILELAIRIKEDDMPISDKDIERIAKAVAEETAEATVRELLRTKVKLDSDGSGESLQLLLRHLHNGNSRVLGEVRELTDLLKADDGDDGGVVPPKG